MFTMPLSAFMIDYTFGNNYCYIAIQKMDKMSRTWDPDTERHFYFGDVFFKQFIGIFDQGNGMMGLAQSVSATSGATLACPGTSCSEATEEEKVGPDPTPVTPDDDTPEEQGGSNGSSEDYWLWIVIGLSVLVLIVLIVCFYYWRKSKK